MIRLFYYIIDIFKCECKLFDAENKSAGVNN